ncbi:hypothetical protein MMC29_007432, partial [Sticta canariensis]|nr:hypothetical protein [Sticta canariensis]
MGRTCSTKYRHSTAERQPSSMTPQTPTGELGKHAKLVGIVSRRPTQKARPKISALDDLMDDSFTSVSDTLERARALRAHWTFEDTEDIVEDEKLKTS